MTESPRIQERLVTPEMEQAILAVKDQKEQEVSHEG